MVMSSSHRHLGVMKLRAGAPGAPRKGSSVCSRLVQTAAGTETLPSRASLEPGKVALSGREIVVESAVLRDVYTVLLRG